MSRAATLLFSIVAYAIFFATFLYLIVFVGDLSFANVTVDRGGPQAAPATAAVIDVALIALFGLQHSVMARQGFKRWWTQVIPKPAERSVYVLMASAAVANTTKVLRSTDFGTIRVHQRLKPWRAITLCWTAKTPSRTTLTIRASSSGPGVPESIVFGTMKLPIKAMAYANVAKNATYAAAP